MTTKGKTMLNFENRTNEKELQEYISIVTSEKEKQTALKFWERYKLSPEEGLIPFIMWIEIEKGLTN